MCGVLMRGGQGWLPNILFGEGVGSLVSRFTKRGTCDLGFFDTHFCNVSERHVAKRVLRWRL